MAGIFTQRIGLFNPAAGGSSVIAVQTFAADGATAPFYGMSTWPAAFYDSATDKTWIARESYHYNARFHRVRTYDHATSQWSGWESTCGVSQLTDDDHGVPALFVDADGRIHWFGGAHGSDMRHSYTVLPGDMDSWTTQTAITGAYTYPHPVFDGTNLFLFLRKELASSPYWMSLVLRKSTAISGGQITFAADVSLVDFGSDTRIYLGWTYDDGTDIHLFFTYSDGADTFRRNQYHVRYEKSSGDLKNSDGSRTDSSLPINKTTADTYYRYVTQTTNETNVGCACIDIAGDFHACYLDGSGSSWEIKHIILSGGSWSSATTAVTLTNASRHEGLALYAAADGSVELYYADDTAGSFTRGGADMMRKIYNGSWGASVSMLTTATAYQLDAPSPVAFGDSELRMIFSEYATSPDDSGAGALQSFAAGDGLATPAAYTPDEDVVLQISFDGTDAATTAFDEGIYSIIHLLTFAGNAQLDTAQFKFGTASLLLDGNGDFVSCPESSLTDISVAGDMTIEAWFRISAMDTGANQTIIDTRSSAGTGGFTLVVSNTSGKLVFQAYNGSTAVVNLATTTSPAIAGAFEHARAVRSGTTWYLFLNGAMEASGTESATPSSQGTVLYIGRSGASTALRYFKGHIDEVQITRTSKGTTSFTPASSAYAHP